MLKGVVQYSTKDFQSNEYCLILDDSISRPDDRDGKLNRRYLEGKKVYTTKKYWNSLEEYATNHKNRLNGFVLEFVYE
jgi:hypothetical protein